MLWWCYGSVTETVGDVAGACGDVTKELMVGDAVLMIGDGTGSTRVGDVGYLVTAA